MQTIKRETKNEIIVNRSKFITIFLRLDEVSLVKVTVETIKKLYPDATHYSYAYIIGQQTHASDDGEPNGTAGLPILNVLRREHLSNVLCLVIRYYGGIKLGVGPLARAYTKAVTLALYESEKINLVKGLRLVITFDYSNTKAIDYLLKDLIIVNQDFNEHVTYSILISNDYYEKIKDELVMLANTIYEKENVFIEK